MNFHNVFWIKGGVGSAFFQQVLNSSGVDLSPLTVNQPVYVDRSATAGARDVRTDAGYSCRCE
jgi:hypothetical protein